MEDLKNTPEADKILEIPISYEERGKEIGEKIGKEIGKKEVAKEMLREGADEGFIAKVTHLDSNEIKKLKEQL